MPEDPEQIRPVSLPPGVGDAILHAEPLRHGQANAATGGIWRDGGWAGSDDAVRTAIYASGAAKYSWFSPAMALRAARDDLGRSSYRQDTSAAAAIRRLTPLVTLIADWADQITPLR